MIVKNMKINLKIFTTYSLIEQYELQTLKHFGQTESLDKKRIFSNLTDDPSVMSAKAVDNVPKN